MLFKTRRQLLSNHWLKYQLLKGVILLSYQKPTLQLLISVVFFYLGLKEMYGLLTKSEVKTTEYWPSSFFFFCVFIEAYRRRGCRSPQTGKKSARPISSHLDRRTLVNKGFVIWDKNKTPRTMILVLVYLQGLKGNPPACKNQWCVHLYPHWVNAGIQSFD